MAYEQMPDFLSMLVEEMKDEKIYEVWKSNPFSEKSYKEFKEEVLAELSNKGRSKEDIEFEAMEAKDKALQLLDRVGGE